MKSVAGALLSAVNLLYAALFGGPIDGTAWDVKVRQRGFLHWTSREETLVFHDGKAVIAGEIARGYAPALYETRAETAGTSFSVHLEGTGQDPVDWLGRIKDGRITGVVVVRRRDGRETRYVFTGTRRTG